MKNILRVVLILVFSVAIGEDKEIHAEKPRKTPATSEVVVERSQFEVTAWPTDGNLERCATLDLSSDVEIYFDREWHTPTTNRDVFIDRVGLVLGPTRIAEPEPQYMVLYFDETNFCDSDSRARAFREARAMMRDAFRPDLGDHVMIASYMGGEAPNITTGWINSRDEALDALDALRRDSYAPVRMAVHDTKWWKAIEAMANAIADSDETNGHAKTIMIIASDLPVDVEDGEELLQLNQKLSLARVTIDTRRMAAGFAYGIGSMAWNSGGRYWRGKDTLATAFETKRSLMQYGCKLLVTVPKGTIRSLRADIKKPGFRAESLIATGVVSPQLELEQHHARRLRPQWGQGIGLKTKLWPIGEKQALLFARVSIGEDLPESVSTITLNATIKNGELFRINPRSGYVDTTDSITATIESAELELLRVVGQKTYMYKVRLARSDPTTRVIVESTGGKHGAQAQIAWRPDKKPPWIVANRYGAFEGNLLPLPVMDPLLGTARPVALMGYGCGESSLMEGTLVSPSGTIYSVALKRLPDRPCWYIAQLPILSPGRWLFQPPNDESFAQEPLKFKVLQETD